MKFPKPLVISFVHFKEVIDFQRGAQSSFFFSSSTPVGICIHCVAFKRMANHRCLYVRSSYLGAENQKTKLTKPERSLSLSDVAVFERFSLCLPYTFSPFIT